MNKKILLLLLLFSSNLAIADSCHPAPDKFQKQFIIGYGSFMDEASKRRTAPNAGENIPVKVKGFERAWLMRAKQAGFGISLK